MKELNKHYRKYEELGYMKTPKEICKDIYKFVCATEIKDAITGKVSYTGRKTDKEDCCIELQDNDCDQVQTAFVYVRIYVPNMTSGGKSVENVPRTEPLEKLCATLLERGHGDTFRFELKQQLTLPVQGKDEFVITNKIEYSQFNG